MLGVPGSEPTVVSPLASWNVLPTLTGPERVMLEGVAAPGPDTADWLGGPRWRGYCSSGYFICLVCGCLTTAVKTANKLGARM